MRKLGALLVLALAALTLAACGGGGGGETTGSEATSGGEAAAGGSSTGQSGGGGSVVQIEAAESGLEYKQKSVTAKAGPVTIEFTNPQSIEHDVAVEDANGETVGSTELVAEGKTVATIGKLEAGEYHYYCSVPGHRDAGMEGTLVVE